MSTYTITFMDNRGSFTDNEWRHLMGELGSMSTGFPNQTREFCQQDAFGQDPQQQQQVPYSAYNNQVPYHPMPTGTEPYHPSPPQPMSADWVPYPYEDPSQMYMLQIIEEPISKIRFRYQSERGSHGSMSGRSSTNTQKSWPTVRLLNYPLTEVGEVRVRASLYTEDRQKPHVHKLLGKNCNQEIGDCILNLQPDMTCSFPSLGVLFTEKKRVQDVLLKRKKEECHGNVSEELAMRLTEEAKQEAKDMKLNSIRIRFQAYNKHNEPITEPVYSEPVHNLKSPDSGELKITRLSRCTSKSDGGDEVFLLCEKVNKKDIKVKFFEQNEEGQETWSDFGKFSDSDVHHQVAIVFQTPAYRDRNIEKPVNVSVQLFRQNDGETSESLRFTYKPRNKDPDHIHNKRKRFNDTDDFTRFGDQDFSSHQQNSYGHHGSNPWSDGSGNSGNSMMPPPHGHNSYTTMNQMAAFVTEFAEELRMSSSSPGSSQDSFFSAQSETEGGNNSCPTSATQDPVPSVQQLFLSKPFNADVEHLSDPSIPPTAFRFDDEEIRLPFSLLEGEAEMDSSSRTVADAEMADVEHLSDAVSRLRLPSGDEDSARRRKDSLGSRREPRAKALSAKLVPSQKQALLMSQQEHASSPSQANSNPSRQDVPVKSGTARNTASRIPTDLGTRAAIEAFVKRQMIPRFGRSLRLFTSTGKVQYLLWSLAPFLASQNEEGDNALHLAVIHQTRNQSLFGQLMSVVNSLMPYNVINHTNNNYQTPLHLAVAVQEVNLITWLLLSGADPNLQDSQGNAPFHLAVLKGDPTALHILLDKAHYRIHASAQPLSNTNILNFDGYSALHLSVMRGCKNCLNLLMDSGSDVNIRDGTSGRTPLHMAVEMQSPLVEELLKHSSIEVDAQDYAGNTPLHLACALGFLDIAHTLMRADSNPLARNFLWGNAKLGNDHSYDDDDDNGSDDDNDDDDDDKFYGETPITLAEGNDKLLSVLKGTLTEDEIISLQTSRRRSREEMHVFGHSNFERQQQKQAPEKSEPSLPNVDGHTMSPLVHSKEFACTSKHDSGYGDSGAVTQESCMESKEQERLVGVLSRLLDPPSKEWEKLALVVCEEESLLNSMRKFDLKPTLTLFKKIKERGLILKDTLDAAGLSDIWPLLPDSEHKALNV